MQVNSKIALLTVVLTLMYLVFDIFHFFVYRINPVYPTLTEAFYESTIISTIKWFFCIIVLAGFFLDNKNKRLSFYLIFIPPIGAVLLFLLKGQLSYLIRGSIVFKIGFLEITMLLALFYSMHAQVKKYNIKAVRIIISFLLAVLILGYLLYQLPVYNEPI